LFFQALVQSKGYLQAVKKEALFQSEGYLLQAVKEEIPLLQDMVQCLN
jgi:hypothetical protein